MPAPIVLRTLIPEVKKVDNPPAGQPVIATKAELRDGSRPGGGGSTPIPSNDGWQATLESTFMIADSFDDYEDWVMPNEGGNYVFSSPTRTNGADSIWGRYSSDFRAFQITNPSADISTLGGPYANDADRLAATFSGGGSGEFYRSFVENGKTYLCFGATGGAVINVGETVTIGSFTAEITAKPKWIGNEHPIFRNRGKSLCINYNNFSGGIDGFGPSRMTTFFGTPGDSGSGLKKVHVFWMMYFDPAFFRQNPDGTFPSPGVHKLFDICSGHIGLNDWGSAAEKLIVGQSPQQLLEYGLNHTIVGSSGGGLSTPERLFLTDTAFYAGDPDSNGVFSRQDTFGTGGLRLSDAIPNNDTDINPYCVNGEWFGVEFAFDIGTVDSADGSVEFWLYNEAGTQVGYFSNSGDSRLGRFDHKYNLFTLGGNRICNDQGTCDPEAHSRIYVDDFILHSSRIGPTYFQTLTDFEGGPL